MKKLTRTNPRLAVTSILLGLAATTFATAADLNVPTTAYPTIQKAIDAADSGDTIHIAPGVYTEQVQIIAKTLTLIGQPGTILRATETLTAFPGGIHFPIMGIRSSQVTLRGLTFEGERLAERFVGVGALLGLYLRESGGIVENCTFYGFRENTPGHEDGNAIGVLNVVGEAVDFRLVGSTFADNYGGIFLVGAPSRQSINVTIENNTFIGPGPLDSDVDHLGIFIREGVGGRIAGNTISGYAYIGTKAAFPISFGILAANEANFPPGFGTLQHLEIEGNTFRNNQFHVAVVKGDGSVVRNNRFEGTAPGIVPVGLAVTGADVTIADNHFVGMKDGIRLMGNDPTFGTLLGAAVNAQVTNNRFCDVAAPITVQSLASAKQVGTLLCPIPLPPLAIAPAVLLSWPGEDNGLTVESAPGVDGPWSAVDATLFTQGGRHSLAVPTEGARRIFRLR